MCRYILENELSDPESLKLFNSEGYYFEPSESTDDMWVFKRDGIDE